MAHKPTLLIILDGFGHAPPGKYNAISQARTPHLSDWLVRYPSCYIRASGTAVGLPDGYIGNSEVGHETIGSGRVIKQPLTVLFDAIRDGSLDTNKTLILALQQLALAGRSLHIMGLLSDAGVHSHIDHLFAFLRLAKCQNVKQTYLHLFLDGRDVPPQSAATYLGRLEQWLQQNMYGKIASIHGRLYAMDRDKNWDRTEKSYAVLTGQQSLQFNSWSEILNYYYYQGITDEFIPPTICDSQGIIYQHDGILSFNFRADRIRQLTTCFVDSAQAPIFITPPLLSCFITPYLYAQNLPTESLFQYPEIHNTLKYVLTASHKTLFTIAETEKYAHVTYFFNGEREENLLGETRVMIPSIKTVTYASHPCMRALEITNAVIEALHKQRYDFYLINYANADMVGHSGDLGATIRAIECLDKQLKRLYDEVIKQYRGVMYITADHGKAEKLWDERNRQPCTAHTTNLVPFLEINSYAIHHSSPLPLYELADIAPYILKNMALEVPKEMHRSSSIC